MNLLVIDHWPMWIGLIWMAIVAGVDVITDKVPNRLTIPFGLLGLIVGLLSSLGLTAGITVTGGIGSALLGLLVAFLLSVVFYAARRIGGGRSRCRRRSVPGSDAASVVKLFKPRWSERSELS